MSDVVDDFKDKVIEYVNGKVLSVVLDFESELWNDCGSKEDGEEEIFIE